MTRNWIAYVARQGFSPADATVRHRRRFARGSLSAAAWLAAAVVIPPAVLVHASDTFSSPWVATWGAPAMPPGSAFAPARAFQDQTIRHIVHVSVGGKRIRIRLSNAFSSTAFDNTPPSPDRSAPPLVVGAAHVAIHNGGASIVPGSGRMLRFAGQTSIAVPAGAVAVSDPIDMDVANGGDLAVSVYFPSNTGPATYVEEARQTAYISAPGNYVSAPTFPVAEETVSRFFLTAVEVVPTRPVGVVVAFGDSITLGGDSTVDANHRWPDFLSARLNPSGAQPRLGVVNQGVGCGRLLYDFCGQNGAARFDREVAAVTGVSHVIVALGLNDISLPGAFGAFFDLSHQVVSADSIIRGLRQIIERAHERRIKAVGATLTPVGSSIFPGFFTPENEAKRQAVNKWIRTSGAFDGVVDFDKAVRDPSQPDRLLPAYDSGNGVHPSDAGYEAMAEGIDLSLFF